MEKIDIFIPRKQSQPANGHGALAEAQPAPTHTWSPAVRYGTLIAITALGLLFVARVRVLLGPLSVAALIAFLLHPLATLVQRRLIRSWQLAVMTVFGLFLLLLSGGLVALGPVLVGQSQVVIAELQSVVALLQNSAELTLFGISIPIQTVSAQLLEATTAALSPEQAFSVLRAVSTNFGWVLITLFCTFYFLLDGHTIRPKLVALAPAPLQNDFGRISLRITAIWRAYLRGQLLLMVIVGAATTLTLAALGIRSAFAVGILTGVLDLIPSLGPGIAALIAMVVAAIEGSAFIDVPNSIVVIAVVVIYSIIQTAENVWLRPRIMGERLNMHPAVVFVAIIASITLSGVLLALFIIPLISSLQVIMSYLRHRIYGTDPWDSAETA